MKRNTPSKSKKKLSPTMQVTLIVAALGCAGTVVTALVTGYFAYLSTTTQIDRPIAFTQTAQSQPTQPASTFDWMTILSIDPSSSCPTIYTPAYLFAGGDKFSWVRENIESAYMNDELMYAPLLFADTQGSLELTLTITSSPNNKDWINLSKDLTISIRYIDKTPLTSEIIQFAGCGEVGSFRYFSPVPLNTDYPQYNVISSSTDADFYTLEPGEFEIFILEFQCRSPGLYSLDVNIPIKIQGRDENVSYTDFPGINCPNQINYNLYAGEIYEVEQYEWTGNEYQKISP